MASITDFTNTSKYNDRILKKITYGPMSYENYMEYRIDNKTDEDKSAIKFRIEQIRKSNPYMYRIIELVIYYIDTENTIGIDRKYICINKIPTRILKRKQWVKFGNKNTNNNCTTISDPIFIVPPGRDSEIVKINYKLSEKYKQNEKKYSLEEIDLYSTPLIKTSKSDYIKVKFNTSGNTNNREINKIQNKIMNNNTSNKKFKMFMPSKNAISMFNTMKQNSKEDNSDGGTSNTKKKSKFSMGYLPPGMKRHVKRERNPDVLYSIVIKNIPTYINSRDIEQRLKDIFKSFGDICKVKCLRDNNNPDNFNRGLAFIDFYDKDAANQVLSSNNRHTIDSMVLSIEKKKN
jgi:hypothetical protein